MHVVLSLCEVMGESESRALGADNELYDRVRRLIIGRLGLIFLLLLAYWWRTAGYFALMEATEGRPLTREDELLLFFSVTLGLTAVYYAALRFAGHHLWQARLQFVIDLALITWLVWRTGDLISPYITLYIVLISVAGFFLGKTETLVLSIGCALAFTVLAVMTSQGMIFSQSGEQPAMRVAQIIGVNNIAILLVGLLAARLSERRRIQEQLKHTEESFADLHILHERIVESIGTGLATTDLSGRIYSFNAAAERISGIAAADAIGRNVLEIFGNDARRTLRKCLADAEAGDPGSAEFETVFPARNGARPGVTAACAVFPLIGKGGERNGLIVTFQDVTHMKALEETVRRSDRLAAVGRMAAGLAHELRNPLGSMSSALQFLQERNGQAGDEDLMKVVLQESDRLNAIITSFLAFARPSDNGQSGSGIAPLNLGQAIKDCLMLLEHSPDVTPEHDFEFVQPDQPVVIDANEPQIKQVIWNLTRNAIEAMPQGGLVKVELAGVDRKALLTFSDTGPGIDESVREHLFEPFISGRGGLGLGLSIVHTIVEDHNGRVDVKSTPGAGTRVTVTLPIAKEIANAHFAYS
jgi:two-component system, NtrC family, sensor histidine kinase PilS